MSGDDGRGHYLDAAAFTRLFHRRRRNHAQICLGLQRIVAGVARRFWFATPDDRQELEAEVLLFAIQRIDRFKFASGKDAFTYYTSVIRNRLLRELHRADRVRRRARMFTDLHAERHHGDVAAAGTLFENGLLARARPYARAS